MEQEIERSVEDLCRDFVGHKAKRSVAEPNEPVDRLVSPHMSRRAVVWFRHDLRLVDNPAWNWASEWADEVLPVVIVEPSLMALGKHRVQAFAAAIASLQDELATRNASLLLIEGPTSTAVGKLIDQVDALAFNESVGPWGRARDAEVRALVASQSHCRLATFWGSLVCEPGTVLTAKGTLSQVFTPFWKKWQHTPQRDSPAEGHAEISMAEPKDLGLQQARVTEERCGSLPIHRDDIAANFARWNDDIERYDEERDHPGRDGTSRLSAALRLGTVSPLEILDHFGAHTPGRLSFSRQLSWRDWWAHTMLQHQDLALRPLRSNYDAIVWRDHPTEIEAWKHGRTGFPIVDAGMRQLAETGWMHNRVRMITASFLVKDLLVDWRIGERWFAQQLADYDAAQNAGNWQWIAGTGPDAAPYFRIFNPTSQGLTHDPDGEYVRRWVPELAGLDATLIHEPSKAAPLDLAAQGIVLGDDYPYPIVDHRQARLRTLEAYGATRARSANED